MSTVNLDSLCEDTGINPGTANCAPKPGVGKYLAIWGGRLTPTQLLAGYATCKAQLIADSKKSKAVSSKLILFPIFHDIKPTKEANTVVTLPDGFQEVKREGLPAYEIEIRTDLYQGPILRRLNNKRIQYCFIDDKNQFLGTFDTDGNMTGRYGKLYTEGVDVTGYDKASGQVKVSLQAENAFETFDFPTCIQLDSDPSRIFKTLKDMQLYEKVAATLTSATAPTRTVTMTAVGADGSTTDIQLADGTSISGGPVEKTSSESSVTLLATKIKDAINTATATNGGFTATNLAGVITITAPGVYGATLNTVNTAPVIVGDSTASSTAWTGGVNGHYVFHISAKINPSPTADKTLDFYSEFSTSALGTDKTLWKVTRTDTDTDIAVVTLAPNASGYFDVTPTTATIAGLARGTVVTFTFVDPPTLDAANVVGIEGVSLSWTKP